MNWYGNKAKADARTGAIRGLKQAGYDLLQAAQKDIPVADGPGGGYMRDTGRVTMDERAMRVAVSFDSPPVKNDGRARPSQSVVIFLHENMNAHHRGGKSAKFLERPLNEARRTGLATIANEIRKQLR